MTSSHTTYQLHRSRLNEMHKAAAAMRLGKRRGTRPARRSASTACPLAEPDAIKPAAPERALPDDMR